MLADRIHARKRWTKQAQIVQSRLNAFLSDDLAHDNNAMHTKRRWRAVSEWLDHCRRSVIADVITLSSVAFPYGLPVLSFSLVNNVVSVSVTLLVFFMLYAVALPALKILADVAQRRYLDLKGMGATMDMTPGPNGVVFRSVYFSFFGAVLTTCSTLPSIKENWMYESVGDGNPPFPYWWLILTVVVAAGVGGNLYVFCYKRYVIEKSSPTDA